MTDILTAVLRNQDALVVGWPDLGLLSPGVEWNTNSPLQLSEFPFLESMLDGAEPSDFEGEPLGPWEQDEGAFLAEFLKIEQGTVLLLRRLGQDYQEQVALLQTARENSLAHEALVRETKKKEYLLHCIVHDLAGPLTSIKGALHIMNRPSLPEETVQELLKIGFRQCARQESMIKEILEVFAAELKVAERRETKESAQLPEVARAVTSSLQAAFANRGLELKTTGPQDLMVVGEDSKLERVISNLVENALRNATTDTEVEIRTVEEDGFALTEILDRGPGVPDEVTATLFQAFSKSGPGGGKIGLGLYFCRITVESWGGEIGYRHRAGGGANFWFKLPLRPESQ